MEISFNELRHRASKIKWFFCDIDGTLTDAGVYYSPEGELMKKFSLRDGTGFFLLKEIGIKTGVITTECSLVVKQRVQKLNINKYIYGTHRKLETMQKFAEEEGLTLDEIAFIGDEINDVKLLSSCGLGFAVADADFHVQKVAHIVCKKEGGKGAFREAVDILLELKNVSVDTIIDNSL